MDLRDGCRSLPDSGLHAPQPPRGGVCRDHRVESWMVLPLDMAFELRLVVVHGPQRAHGVVGRLVVEMRRCGIAALAAGGDRPGTHFGTEFHDRNEAVADIAIPLFGVW